MKSEKSFLILLIGIFSFGTYAQDLIPPADGNAAIYIVHTTSFGSALTFKVFHNESFVGVFTGKGYMRYELPAGKQLLWFDSENKRFLDCDLKSGGIYLISSMHSPGVVKNHVVLNPITFEDSNFEKCKNVILNGKSIITPEKKIAEIQKKLTDNDFINTVLKQYKEEQKYIKQTKIISADMAIPLDKLQ